MEFNKKLQELRKQKGLTQEDLAEMLHVSRTAISKWESGRGYPNIDSLKAIATLFSVTIDELLSNTELLSIAQEDNKQKEKHTRNLVFGLLDISVAIFFFLPFFGQKAGEIIEEVSLLSLLEIPTYLKVAYFTFTIAISIWGILTLAFQNCNFWLENNSKISLILTVIGTLMFIISLQPYAAIFLLLFLLIKIAILIKW